MRCANAPLRRRLTISPIASGASCARSTCCARWASSTAPPPAARACRSSGTRAAANRGARLRDRDAPQHPQSGLEILLGGRAGAAGILRGPAARPGATRSRLAPAHRAGHQVLESYQYVEQSWLAPKEIGFEQPSPAALRSACLPEAIATSSTTCPTISSRSRRTADSVMPRSRAVLGRLTAGAVALDIDGQGGSRHARWRRSRSEKYSRSRPGCDAVDATNPRPIGTDPTAGGNEARLLADLLTGVAARTPRRRDFIAPAIYDVAINS